MKTFGTPVMHVERILFFYINTSLLGDRSAAPSSRSLVLNIPFAHRHHGRSVTQYFDSPVRQRQRRMHKARRRRTDARARGLAFLPKPDTVKVDARSLTQKVLILFESRPRVCVCALSRFVVFSQIVWLIYAAAPSHFKVCSYSLQCGLERPKWKGLWVRGALALCEVVIFATLSSLVY